MGLTRAEVQILGWLCIMSLFGLIYTAIKNSLSRLQPLQGISYECFCVNERKIFLKKSHQKLTWEGVEPTTLWLPDHCSINFNNFLLQLSIIFLLDVSHAHSDLLIPLFVANVHMISNRKTFVLNHAQLGFKFEKFYLSKSD